MQQKAQRLGAIFYALWGILHIVGGAAILAAYFSEGGVAALAMYGTALAQADLPTTTHTVIDGLAAYNAFNIFWFGVVVTGVAVFMNWHNSLTGYWINLVLVSVVDIGLFFAQVFPGRIAWGDALIGAGLWIPAVIFSTIAIRLARNERRVSSRLSPSMQGV